MNPKQLKQKIGGIEVSLREEDIIPPKSGMTNKERLAGLVGLSKLDLFETGDK